MKNTVKKLMALLLAAVMLLALAACGQKDAKDDGKVELPVADGAVIGTGATKGNSRLCRVPTARA